jgi:hypothetical protein
MPRKTLNVVLIYTIFLSLFSSAKAYMMHRRMIERMMLKFVIIYVLIPFNSFAPTHLSTEYVTCCMVHRIIMLRKAPKVVVIYVLFSPPLLLIIQAQHRICHILHGP